MIEEKAQVIELKGEMMILQAQTQSACGGCEASKGCGTSVLSKVVGKKFSRFQALNDIDAKPGDTVLVGIAEDALLKGSFVMYLIPLLGMLIIAILTDYLVEVSPYKDLLIATSAMMGLALGALLARAYFRRLSCQLEFSPVVLRKIIEHGKLTP